MLFPIGQIPSSSNPHLFCELWPSADYDGQDLFNSFIAKGIFVEEQLWYYLTHSWEDKEVHTFPKSIYLKVDVIAQRIDR